MVLLSTLISILAAVGIGTWLVARIRSKKEDAVAVRLRLDHSGPGAHLVWDIANTGAEPITVTRLVIRTRTGGSTVPLGIAQVLNTQERTVVPTDVDLTLLSATSMAVCDGRGGEHIVSPTQLKQIQEQLGSLVARRDYAPSATDWLHGATDLAVGVVILGLGFFMLMWVIATG
jgi:hypothetical protein